MTDRAAAALTAVKAIPHRPAQGGAMENASEPDPRMAPDPPVEDKVAFLRDPASYPHAPSLVEVKETHMAWVFLAGGRVYKMKKPVRYAFLDFSTLGARAHVVSEEIRLNRRLAPGVYLGRVALTADPGGRLRLGGTGRVVEWLVAMRRLPEARMLDRLIEAGGVAPGALAPLAARLVRFYGDLPGEEIAPEEHLSRLEAQHRETARVLRDPRFALDGRRLDAVIDGFERALEAARPALEARVRAGRIVEGHGDLRPEHVCLSEPPAIIDCLEFDRTLRLVDPFDEIAFLGMEAARLGDDGVFPFLRERLAEGLPDDPGDALLGLYWRYRALLRARLSLLHLVEPNPREPEKWRPQAWTYVRLAEEAGLRCRSR
jgi:aminoglycoside phosphotransferase family enzyme